MPRIIVYRLVGLLFCFALKCPILSRSARFIRETAFEGQISFLKIQTLFFVSVSQIILARLFFYH